MLDLSQKILSDITIYGKYARYIKELKRRETWDEIVHRNLSMHVKKYPQLEGEINDVYQLVYDKKVLPSMRSMQFAGKPIEVNPSRMFNCAYLPMDDWRGFSETMFLLLGGTGVGFSVQHHHIHSLPEIIKPNPNRKRRYLIGDSIEGWSDTIRMLMKSYFFGTSTIDFDFSDIRSKGALLVTSGGRAPGPQPLIECVVKIKGILDQKNNGENLTSIEVYDIVCHIADAVLAGGIRRAALICLFSADDMDMISSKSGDWRDLHPHRARSNNSAVLLRHRISKEFFFKLWERIKNSGSGEPGIYFSNDKDWGANPCVEISLRAHQFCNLTEINGDTIESQEDFNQRAKGAAFIGTLQAGYTDFHYLRGIWQRTTEKDALLGASITGISSMKIFDHNIGEAALEVVKENERVSQIIGINAANRSNCVKPAGTTSLVLSTASGIHARHNDYYLRRLKLGKDEALCQYLSIYHPELLEDDLERPHDTSVVSVPQKSPNGSVTRHERALDLLKRVKKVSQQWVLPGHKDGQNTHNVSATVSVRDGEWNKVRNWMWKNRKHYNGLAVLPYDGGTYKQAPFEDISKSKYYELLKHLEDIDLTKVIENGDNTDLKGEIACAGAIGCEII